MCPSFVFQGVFLKLSWDQGFSCVLSINRLFSPSSPLEIILGQAVPAQDLLIWICPSPTLRLHPSSCPGCQGGVSPSAYEIWLVTSAQMLQPWPPSSPAAQGSSVSIPGQFLSPTHRACRHTGAPAMPSSPSPSGAARRSFPLLFARAWGSLGRREGCDGFMAHA